MALLAVVAFLALGGADDTRILLPADYGGARITGGMLKQQLDEAKQYYLRIPNDDLLLGFRRRAGKPAPGRELGGWYSGDVFHVFGQILSGLARMYAATGDQACKEKAGALLDGWHACIAPDGYFFYSKRPNAPHYIYDKMVGGLVDVAVYAGRKDALEDLARITRWAEEHLARTRPYGGDPNEWYTLSENLYRAYLVTKDVRYRDFARVWRYEEYWRHYATNESIFAGRTKAYHAYSHLNTLGGAAMAYRVEHDARYLDSAKNAYQTFQREQCFATGGFGPDESLLPRDALAEHLDNTTNTFETQCGTWAVFKLCKQLITMTGDARYGDWIERVAYNGIGATIPMSTAGNVFYYSNYNPHGGEKVNHPEPWTCCTGTRLMSIADVTDLIYFKAPDGLDVNLFIPSTIRIEGGEVEQRTRFPEEPKTGLILKLSRPRSFALRIRRPGWATRVPSIHVNGQAVPAGLAHGWISVKRTWRSGDKIEVDLPMELRTQPMFAGAQYPCAVMLGPIALAFRADSPMFVREVDPMDLRASMEPSRGEPLTFHLRQDPSVLARPFYAYKEGEPYFLYLDPKAASRVIYRRMRISAGWRDSGQFWFGNQPGAWIEGEFEGAGVRLLGYRFDDAGRAEISIDGKTVATIDQYGPGRGLPFDWHITGLSKSKHVLRITVIPDKTAESVDRFINVAGLEVLPD